MERLANILNVELKDFFDFGHEVSLKELREAMNKFSKEQDKNNLRMAVNPVRKFSLSNGKARRELLT